jgi:hypothetical protein
VKSEARRGGRTDRNGAIEPLEEWRGKELPVPSYLFVSTREGKLISFEGK